MENFEKELIFKQYKMYSEQKDNFITRSFGINRFYLCISLILLLLIPFTRGLVFAYGIPLGVFLAIFGMCCSALWWMNMDSYNILIKVKFSKVLEEIEKDLPKQPYADEYKGIKDFRENKKMFLFSDIQKLFAVILFLIFFVGLIEDIIPVIIG